MTDDTVVSINSRNRVEAKEFLERLLELVDTSESFQFVGYAMIDGDGEYQTHVDSIPEGLGMAMRLVHRIQIYWDEQR